MLPSPPPPRLTSMEERLLVTVAFTVVGTLVVKKLSCSLLLLPSRLKSNTTGPSFPSTGVHTGLRSGECIGYPYVQGDWVDGRSPGCREEGMV